MWSMRLLGLAYLTVLRAISHGEVLQQVNTDDARAMIVTTPVPDRMLAAILMARTLNPTLLILAITDSGKWLTHAGASEVVFSDELIAKEVVNRLDVATSKQ